MVNEVWEEAIDFGAMNLENNHGGTVISPKALPP